MLITYALWSGGLFNQLMSIENASIISSILASKISIHSNIGLDANWRNINQKRTKIIGNRFPRIEDLIENKDLFFFENLELSDEPICHPEQKIQSFFKTVISVDGSEPNEQFLDGRNWVYLNTNSNYRFIETLGWYSIVFWNMPSLQNSNFKIKFKSEYVDFASKITKEIGDFSSIHVRGEERIKINEFNLFNICQDINNLLGNTVVVVADELNVNTIKSDKKIIDIGSFIMDNFLNEFMKLPFHDETTFGLVCLLVACNSRDFSGTLGSTYTGYIHRQMRIKNKEYKYKFIGHTPPEFDNKNPWYLYKDLAIETKIWCREWK